MHLELSMNSIFMCYIMYLQYMSSFVKIDIFIWKIPVSSGGPNVQIMRDPQQNRGALGVR